MNTYALSGTQRNAAGQMFCTLQATRDYKSFFKLRLEANPYMSAAQIEKSDFKTRAMWTEDVNARHITLTQAIYESFPARAQEHWTANSTTHTDNGPPNKRAKIERTQTERTSKQQLTEADHSLPPHAVKENWEKKRGGKDLCRNFQVGCCKRKDCKNLHERALPSCRGEKHAAKDCKKKEK